MRTLFCLKHILHLFVAITLLNLLPSVNAQPAQFVTENWRDEDFNFSARMMASDQADNVYVLGDTVVGDFVVIKKFSASGVLLWQTSYNPAERLRGVWIAIDREKNPVVLAAIITGSNADPAGWLTLKYDTNGTLLWANSLPGPYSDPRRVAIDGSSNIFVAGRMWLNNSTANISLDSVLIKYSPNGATLWRASFDNGNGTAVDEPYSLVISPDSSRIGVAGKSGNLFMALMYDTNGKLLWSSTNTSLYPSNDLAFGPGNVSYFATGVYLPFDPDPYRMAIAKFDSGGRQLWIKNYSVGDRTYRVKTDSQGNVVATGIDGPEYYTDWMTIKTDANGNLLWSQRYDGGRNNHEIPNMLLLDSSDAVYVTGTGGPNPSIGTVSYLKGVIAKYSAAGTPQWALWDVYANGKALTLGSGNTLASLGFGYLVTAHYTQTGLPDLIPAAPTNLDGSVWFTGSSDVVNLTFADNASNEFWVDVERCIGFGCTNFSKTGQTRGENSTGFRDTNVSRGTTYTYRVRAVGFMGSSPYSNSVAVTLSPSDPPAAPSNLTTSMSGTSVVLNWQDNSANETQFYVERCEGPGCTAFIGLAASAANITNWTDYNATAGQSYSYRVRAWNSDGYSTYSNTTTILTPGGSTSPPLAPSNLIAKAFGKSQINLSWTNNGNQDGVKIERCLGSGCTNFMEVAAVGGNASFFSDTGLAAGTTYRYRLRAYNSAGNSPYSTIAAAKTSRR
ncbi:MAG TPA: hypothetical protein VLA93_00910 [Pyrinomonadaceae bacterium]|nr:hypothetical protein [Pyrinomonadaceae bacterium]